MLFFKFHIGDWDSGTKLLTPTERGVYLDLLLLYYTKEEPILRSYCERITRGYTEAEREAAEFVLSEFFTLGEDGRYHNQRADAEIAAAREKSQKARESVMTRYRGKSNTSSMQKETLDTGIDANVEQKQCERNTTVDTNVDTNVEQTQHDRSTNVLLTNNQVTNISTTVVNTPVVDSTPRAKMPSGGHKARTYKLDVKTLPDDWRAYCEQTRPDLDPDVVFTAFRSCFTSGSKAGTMRSEKGWNQSWFNWVRNERERYNTGARPQRKQGPKTVEPDFSLMDYGETGLL